MARSFNLRNGLFDEFQPWVDFWSSSLAPAHARTALPEAAFADVAAQFQIASSEKFLTAFPADGVGHRLTVVTQDPGDVLAVGLITDPDIPNDQSTTAGVTVGGPSFISTINSPGDQDWIRVELQAGVTYEIGLFSTTEGPSGVPLLDPLVELYNADGLFEGMDDSSGPSSPNGTDDALLTFTATESGVYYINARAWDTSDPTGIVEGDPNPLTATGDYVGDYQAFVRVSNSTGPYYPIDFETQDDPTTARNEVGLPTLDSSPLHAIDWGSRLVNKDGITVRNPDGEEGPRPTNNPYQVPDGETQGFPGKNVITVYFAKAGEVYVDEDPTSPGSTDTMVARGFEDWEIAAYKYAFEAYANVADLVYVVVDDAYDPLTMTTTADFTFVVYEGTTGQVGPVGTPSLLGRMSPPDEDNEGRSEFNGADIRWTQEGLAPGGFSFNTLIHEMGHGHGLAHPHDTGGGSSEMRGVFEESLFNYSRGDFDLNQGAHTMMSYEDGWETSPYGQASTTDPFGWVGGLMAFDVAAIQDKYGVNEEWATGNDTYVLRDENVGALFDENNNIIRDATAYRCIWDAGGTDAIVYDGARDSNIDLRAATLKYEVGGGGWMSYAWGVHGGYTIANGVTIENARTGSGNDKLTGNDVANRLEAGAGDDSLTGGAGNDILIGGAGRDALSGGAGSDLYLFGNGDGGIGLARDVISGFEQGSDRIDLTGTGASRFIGTADFSGGAGQVRYVSVAGTTIIEVDQNGDALTDFQIEIDSGLQLTLEDFVDIGDANGATNGNDILIGTAVGEVLNGYAGDDVIDAGGGDDQLIGGTGVDRLTGGSGADLFVYTSVADSPLGGADVITDFTRRADRFDLSQIDANAETAGNDAFQFIGKSAFSGTAGELRYATIDGATMVLGDVDGDAVADFQVLLADKTVLLSSDFIF